MAKISISEEVNAQLRNEIFRRWGSFKKGDIKAAVEEAIDDWIAKRAK